MRLRASLRDVHVLLLYALLFGSMFPTEPLAPTSLPKLYVLDLSSLIQLRGRRRVGLYGLARAQCGERMGVAL